MSKHSLYITFVEAVLTHDTEMFGKMDPYVRITSEQFGVQTKVCEKGGKKPKWD